MRGTVAAKADRAKRAPTFVLPSRGGSAVDGPGKPFYGPEVNRVFFSELRSLLSAHIRVVEVAVHVNDEACRCIKLHSPTPVNPAKAGIQAFL